MHGRATAQVPRTGRSPGQSHRCKHLVPSSAREVPGIETWIPNGDRGHDAGRVGLTAAAQSGASERVSDFGPTGSSDVPTCNR